MSQIVVLKTTLYTDNEWLAVRLRGSGNCGHFGPEFESLLRLMGALSTWYKVTFGMTSLEVDNIKILHLLVETETKFQVVKSGVPIMLLVGAITNVATGVEGCECIIYHMDKKTLTRGRTDHFNNILPPDVVINTLDFELELDIAKLNQCVNAQSSYHSKGFVLTCIHIDRCRTFRVTHSPIVSLLEFCSIWLQMVAVIGLSILFNIPRYLDDHVVRRPDGSLTLERTYLGNDNTFQLIYAGLLYYVVIYVLPVVILTAMTYRQIIVLARPRLFQHLVQDHYDLTVKTTAPISFGLVFPLEILPKAHRLNTSLRDLNWHRHDLPLHQSSASVLPSR